jgi:5-formyltetrahydrofolate cyclo-ligase
MIPPKKQRLRLRAARRSLTGRARRTAESVIIDRILRLTAFRRARIVACYMPFDGEVDLRPLMYDLQPAGKSYCIPAVSRSHSRQMRFLSYRPGEHLVKNRFGVGEPLTVGSSIVPSSAIDVALMPVVGFDKEGSRIGMGAGYYDRFFGRYGAASYRHARLVGIAFDRQRLPRIERRDWDVPLDMVVTERCVYRPNMTSKTTGPTSR